MYHLKSPGQPGRGLDGLHDPYFHHYNSFSRAELVEMLWYHIAECRSITLFHTDLLNVVTTSFHFLHFRANLSFVMDVFSLPYRLILIQSRARSSPMLVESTVSIIVPFLFR